MGQGIDPRQLQDAPGPGYILYSLDDPIGVPDFRYAHVEMQFINRNDSLCFVSPDDTICFFDLAAGGGGPETDPVWISDSSTYASKFFVTSQGYLTSYTETDPVWISDSATYASKFYVNNQGFLTSYTETDPIWIADSATYASKFYVNAVDTGFSNEIQTLTRSNDTIFLSSGGFVEDFWTKITVDTIVNILDDHPAEAAYSLRYLSSTYSGDVVRVRRASDNAELDFNPTEVTDGTLTTWTGANDGYVVTWYDQSGNGRNATQASTGLQPRIVSSGTLVTTNGKPSIDFLTANYLRYAGGAIAITGTQNRSIFLVMDPTSNTNMGTVSLHDGTTNLNDQHWIITPEYGHRIYGSNELYDNGANTTQSIVSSIMDGTTMYDARLWLDGVELGVSSAGGDDLLATDNTYFDIGWQLPAGYYDGTIQEIIVFSSAKTADRNLIEYNMDGYYNVASIQVENAGIYYNNLNVGIGTSSPSYKLDVTGQARFSTSPLTLANGSSNIEMTWDKSGVNNRLYVQPAGNANEDMSFFFLPSTGGSGYSQILVNNEGDPDNRSYLVFRAENAEANIWVGDQGTATTSITQIDIGIGEQADNEISITEDNVVVNGGLTITQTANLQTPPTLDNTVDSMLVRDNVTGNVEVRTVSGIQLFGIDTTGWETNVDNAVSDNGYLTSEVDGSITNELQTLSWGAGTGGNDEITLSDGGGTVTITDDVNDADADPANEIQTISRPGGSLTVTLSDAGGTFQDSVLTETDVDAMVANNGYLTSYTETDPIWVSDSSTYASKFYVNNQGFLTSEVDGSITNEGSLTVGAGTATTSLISSNTSGSTDVTIEAAGINTIAEAGNTITITGTEVDGSITNEGSLTATDGVGIVTVASNTSGSTDLTFTESGIVTVNSTGNNITIAATETDPVWVSDSSTYASKFYSDAGDYWSVSGTSVQTNLSGTNTYARVLADNGAFAGLKLTENASPNALSWFIHNDPTGNDLVFQYDNNVTPVTQLVIETSSNYRFYQNGSSEMMNISGTNNQVEFYVQAVFPDEQLTDAASITWDLDAAQVAFVTLGGNRALANPTNQVGGGHYTLTIKQDGVGSRTLSYGTAYKFPGGTAPTLSTAVNAVDVMTCVSDGTNMYCNMLNDYQ